jgi:hypothetical protein
MRGEENGHDLIQGTILMRLVGLRKITEDIWHDNRYSSRYSNLVPKNTSQT